MFILITVLFFLSERGKGNSDCPPGVEGSKLLRLWVCRVFSKLGGSRRIFTILQMPLGWSYSGRIATAGFGGGQSDIKVFSPCFTTLHWDATEHVTSSEISGRLWLHWQTQRWKHVGGSYCGALWRGKKKEKKTAHAPEFSWNT